MSFPVLDQYLSRLARAPEAGTRLWLDQEGRARAQFYSARLASAFQPIRRVRDGAIVGHEGFLRSHSATDSGLNLWNLLDAAASDDESIELDRLSRTLHALNYFRQTGSEASDLYLSVHGRLLAAVEGDHGQAFGRVLAAFGVPREYVVLQLPAIDERHRWVLKFVAGNYQRNGFRLVLNASDPQQGLALLDQAQPEAIKLDGRSLPPEEHLLRLLEAARERGVKVVFKRVESAEALSALKRYDKFFDSTLWLQGYVWDFPNPRVVQGEGAALKARAADPLAAQVGG